MRPSGRRKTCPMMVGSLSALQEQQSWQLLGDHNPRPHSAERFTKTGNPCGGQACLAKKRSFFCTLDTHKILRVFWVMSPAFALRILALWVRMLRPGGLVKSAQDILQSTWFSDASRLGSMSCDLARAGGALQGPPSGNVSGGRINPRFLAPASYVCCSEFCGLQARCARKTFLEGHNRTVHHLVGSCRLTCLSFCLAATSGSTYPKFLLSPCEC